MKLNIENALLTSKGRDRKWIELELIRLLKELRAAVRNGDMETANRFFDIIVFEEPGQIATLPKHPER